MVCIVTKVDLVDPSIDESVTNVQFSHEVHLLRQFVSLEIGMPVNQVSGLAGCNGTCFMCCQGSSSLFSLCLLDGRRVLQSSLQVTKMGLYKRSRREGSPTKLAVQCVPPLPVFAGAPGC
jgi:hypothetical protein